MINDMYDIFFSFFLFGGGGMGFLERGLPGNGLGCFIFSCLCKIPLCFYTMCRGGIEVG